jgi:SAM-dependent methyltransferase
MITRETYVVPPFDIPQVDGSHTDPIFQDLGLTLERRIAALATERRTPFNIALAAAFEQMRRDVDAGDYAAVQRRFLQPGQGPDLTGALKFFDAPFWVQGKMRIAWRLGLHQPPRRRILDLGAGGGHFLFVAKFWGHSVQGLDLAESVSSTAAMYAGLRRAFAIPCAAGAVAAFDPLPPLGQFDLVTALLVTFCGPREKPWSTEAWSFFLDDVRANLLAPGGRVYLQLNAPLVAEDAWDYLKSQSIWCDEKSRQVML